MVPALIIHGGAWAIPDGEVDAHLDAMRAALNKGASVLSNGCNARDAVVEVITVLEDHPALDAGVGAVLNRAGTVQLDAGMMDGTTRDFGAVAGVQRIKHPIAAARRIIERSNRQYSLLVGPNADAWAASNDLDMVDPEYFIVPRERERFAQLQEQAKRFHTSVAFRGNKRPQGTVGCVALDKQGHVAAGTSTGGAPFTVPGRVGDSPLPGCGYYASPVAGASSTGWGEAISRVLMCGWAVDCMEQGASPQEAAERTVQRLADLVKDPEDCGATGGVILLDAKGRLGFAYNSPRMARGTWTPEKGPTVGC